MNGFDFLPTTCVIFGNDTVDKLGNLATGFQSRRALLVTDAGIVRAGYAERGIQSLQQHKIETILYSDVQENPTDSQVQDAAEFARANAPIDLIIGLGGGSPMDVAKGMNFLLSNGGTMQDYWGFNKAAKPMLPSIGIPTTAGTGSEAQSFALISQDGTHHKMACGDIKARFGAVILDPVITASAPKHVTAISGMDAMTHAVESYVTRTHNPFSQMHSREAWQLLNRNFETVLSDPEDVNARAGMLLGAHFAGVAIEHSMLGAAHACANPLTSRYGIAHGVAVSLMLPAVIGFNKVEIAALYRELDPNLPERIEHFQEIAELPRRLRDCGVEESSLEALARDAATQWTGKHNPRPLTESDFLLLYQQTF